MICIVRAAFTIKTAQGVTELQEGQVMRIADAKTQRLLKTSNIEELQRCRMCRTYAWWLSIHGALVCGVCHPPAAPELVRRWIGASTREVTRNESTLVKHNDVMEAMK